MKKRILAILSVMFLIIGCSDDNSILEPNYNNIETLDKSKSGSSNIKSKYSKNFSINAQNERMLKVSHKWVNSKGEKIKLSAKLHIPENAFEGVLKFDMIFDFDNYALELYPSPFVFDKPVSLDLSFSGIKLTEEDIQNLNFTYLDGSEEIEYDSIEINKDNGTLKVIGAKLKHFSRYGWTRTR
jgi:hypothetical protein